jgi:hypothetical protein
MSPQQETVLGYLKRRRQGVCIKDVPHEVGYTLRNRISELRKKEGIDIEVEHCTFHNHPNPVNRYRLPKAQQELAL